MTRVVLLRISLGLLFLLYPFLIYLGLQEFQPKILASLLLVATVLRFVVNKPEKGEMGMSLHWVAAGVLVTLITFVTDSKYGLFLYPLLVNLAFFAFFAISLLHPPTVIERIARRQRPEFSEKAIVYTRKVTQIWCVFFLLNGGMSVVSAFHSETWWMLYNGFISYILIGLMLAGEYLIRIKVMSRNND